MILLYSIRLFETTRDTEKRVLLNLLNLLNLLKLCTVYGEIILLLISFFASNSSGQMYIFWHDCHTLRVYSTHIGVFK
jgi:hypothetical protein